MFVTFISQCDKKAIKRTRMVLDAFAERIGDNTWQTVITKEGLDTVKKLLRKSATKSTAVSCHWLRSRSRSELLWIIGNKSRFNSQGIVPVNYTSKNVLHTEWSNNWSYAPIIQVSSVLAALLHDIGKTTVGFQKKLRNVSKSADPYRHEWISICIFQSMISDCKTDKEWLERFTKIEDFIKNNPNWTNNISEQLNSNEAVVDFENIPPFAKLITWLIVSHHRMPFYNREYFSEPSRKKMQNSSKGWDYKFTELIECLSPVNGWVKNDINEKTAETDFWTIRNSVLGSSAWHKYISRWSEKALKIISLNKDIETFISNPIILYLSRVSLIFGDHNYSSLDSHSDNRVNGDRLLFEILANTDKNGQPKQSLDEHLLGVSRITARFSHILPTILDNLPSLSAHKPFTKNTSNDQFKWQNKSYTLLKAVNDATRKKGFFGINMASTGCGKTLANARIMYALSGEENVRFTVALGLRILTLQTGEALRNKLQLDDSELAILVGGNANKSLFEINKVAKQNKNDKSIGSESSEALVDGDVDFSGCCFDDSEFGTIIKDDKARKLLYAPIVTCTIDHIISATENARGGKHIIPILRLLSSDLILDEPDDFSQSDLPALARLVHFAGLLGRKVILSSATLTPDFSIGLFKAYKAGRDLWNEHLGVNSKDIVCAWFDENKQIQALCRDEKSFTENHNKFAIKRADFLNSLPPKRIAEVLRLDNVFNSNKEVMFKKLAEKILNGAFKLHSSYHEVCPKTQKNVSVGLIRIAHIKSLISLAESIYLIDNLFTETKIHLCCYHSRQLLLLRNNTEVKLDRVLNRKGENSIFNHFEIFNELDENSRIKNHIFIVLASPVAEIGRDHDYDWAIVEPSSMRSIIQLAGRIWRHRFSKLAETSNILIMETNIKALEYGNSLGIGEVAFTKPEFEDKEFLLETHRISELLTKEQLGKIDSVPRIIKSDNPEPKLKLSDLEHSVIEELLNNPEINYVNAFWLNKDNEHRATVHLQKISPFRADPEYKDEEEFVCIPDENEMTGYKFSDKESAWDDLENCNNQNYKIIFKKDTIKVNKSVISWLNPTIKEALDEHIKRLPDKTDIKKEARKYCYVILDDDKQWNYNSHLGFWYD